MDIVEIIHLIGNHHRANPAHGVDCSCLDQYIQKLRVIFKTTGIDRDDHRIQMRVDYVIRQALER